METCGWAVGPGTDEPGDFAVVERIGQERREAEARDRGRREPGDKFAANAVARIVAGFEDRDRHTGSAQREAEGKSGQAAADNFDGTSGRHGRRTATRR